MWFWHGMGFWGWTMMIAFWAVVVLLVVWAVRPGTTSGPPHAEGALHILDERLARGEIDTDEYRERRAVLVGRRLGPPMRAEGPSVGSGFSPPGVISTE